MSATSYSVSNGDRTTVLLVQNHSCFSVASKCGFAVFSDNDNRGVTNSAAHIKEYIDGTIERLGFAPDLYSLHRIDPSECPSRFYGNTHSP